MDAGGGTMILLPYQYVVLRCVPRADREEFVNVGVVVYCEEARFLAAQHHVDEARIRALAPDLEPELVHQSVAWVAAVCRGAEHTGAAGLGPLGQRFGFLRAPRSTVVRPGPVHGGLTSDPASCLEELMERLVR